MKGASRRCQSSLARGPRRRLRWAESTERPRCPQATASASQRPRMTLDCFSQPQSTRAFQQLPHCITSRGVIATGPWVLSFHRETCRANRRCSSMSSTGPPAVRSPELEHEGHTTSEVKLIQSLSFAMTPTVPCAMSHLATKEKTPATRRSQSAPATSQ